MKIMMRMEFWYIWAQTSGSWRCETVKCSAEPLIFPSKEISRYGHVA